MANVNSESYHSPIGFLTPEYLGFLRLQVVPRFTGTDTCISLVPVNRNRGILIITSLMTEKRQISQGYIIRILQHFATKLWNITNFVMLFQAVMKFLSRSKF
jgi:hypothetical protein